MGTRQPKRAIGYELWTNHDYSYAHLHLDVYLGTIGDAARAYDEYPCASNLEILERIRKAGDSCKYFSEDYEKKLTIRWQADKEHWDGAENGHKWNWYGCQVQNCPMSTRVVQTLAKLLKQIESDRYDMDQPALVITSLTSIGGIPVEHTNDCPYGMSILRGAYDESKITARPWGELPAISVNPCVSES